MSTGASQKDFVLSQRRLGFSWVHIAKEVGVSTKTLKRWRDGNVIEDVPSLGLQMLLRIFHHYVRSISCT